MATKTAAKAAPAKSAPAAGSGAKAENATTCAALSYILIGIIWYFVDEKLKKNAFVKFHVKQGLVLLIAGIAWQIAWGIVGSILLVVSMFVLAPIVSLGFYVPLVWAIIGIIKAVNGKQAELPVIGSYAKIFKF